MRLSKWRLTNISYFELIVGFGYCCSPIRSCGSSTYSYVFMLILLSIFFFKSGMWHLMEDWHLMTLFRYFFASFYHQIARENPSLMSMVFKTLRPRRKTCPYQPNGLFRIHNNNCNVMCLLLLLLFIGKRMFDLLQRFVDVKCTFH